MVLVLKFYIIPKDSCYLYPTGYSEHMRHALTMMVLAVNNIRSQQQSKPDADLLICSNIYRKYLLSCNNLYY